MLISAGLNLTLYIKYIVNNGQLYIYWLIVISGRSKNIIIKCKRLPLLYRSNNLYMGYNLPIITVITEQIYTLFS